MTGPKGCCRGFGVIIQMPTGERRVREYNVAHILRHLNSPSLDHPGTQGQGIDRIAWHCELGIVAPLPGLFKGVQGMASAAVRTERIADKYLNGWWWTLVQKRNSCKKRKWCRSIWCCFSKVGVSFLPANEHSVSLGASANGKLR